MVITQTQTAGYTFHPDVFRDDSTGYEYEIFQDETATEPTEDWDPSCVVFAIIKTCDQRPPHDIHKMRYIPVVDVALDFAKERYFNLYNLDVDEWFMDLCEYGDYFDNYFNHHERELLNERLAQKGLSDWRIDILTYHGNQQSNWGVCFIAVKDGFGTGQDYLNEYEMWIRGNTWGVCPIDDPNRDDLWNIYADSPEEALEYYLENF